jgi:hypothetical protein
MKPTSESLHARVRYDLETGILTWRKGTPKGPAGSLAGWVDEQGYRWLRLDGRLYPAHHVIWCMQTGAWPETLVDHFDTDPANNKWSNLREASKKANQENRRRANSNNKAGLLGVSLQPTGRFQSKICAGGKSIYIGTFDTAALAHAAYVQAKRRLHEGCTL